MSSDFYEQHLRSFPPLRSPWDAAGGGVSGVPYVGGLADLLRVTELILGCHITFVRAGGTLPDGDTPPSETPQQHRCYPVTINTGSSANSTKIIGHLAVMGTPDADACDQWCRALAAFLAESYQYIFALRDAHEELGVPIRLPKASVVDSRLSTSLREQLQTAARLVSANAASLYLLNSTHRTLALRSCVGLPDERLLDPPRPLVDAAADIEAMLGYAVIVNEEFLHEMWQPPELFPTAVCVPVSSSTTILGTAWFYRDRAVDLTDHDLDILELAVGRIASELERVASLKRLDAA